MLHHFRFILPLLARDEDNLTALHYYDSAIQLARHCSRECTEEEFVLGMAAAEEIKKAYVNIPIPVVNLTDDSLRLNDCRLEMLEGSVVSLNDATS